MKITFTRIWYLILTLLTLAVLLLSLARLATPWLSSYKTQIEQYTSEKLGMSVKIHEIQAGWYYLDPVIHLSQVQIFNNATKKPLLVVEDLGVGINFFASLWHWNIQPSVLMLSKVDIHLDSTLFSGQSFFESIKINQPFKLKVKELKVTYATVFNKPLFFSTVRLNINWTNKHININEFLIENPQIFASTKGSIDWNKDKKEQSQSPFIHTETQFVLQDLPVLIKYLPYKVMKPKLSAWLNQSIIGGDRTTGKMIFKGHVSDYPFDNTPEDQGLFLIDSHFENFSLAYKLGWPAGKSMQAHVIFKNRDLMAKINHGMLDQLPLTDIKVQIPSLGLGQETLKIQGHLQTDATHAKHFILNSALKQQLVAFNHMSIAGPALFDVDIQIPLYPENDNNLVKGKVIFLDGTFILPEWWNLHFKHFKGWLTYDQNGITGSQLNAQLFNYPLTLQIKSVEKPQIATLVDISGQLGIDMVKKLFNIFLFDFMQGKTTYKAQLLLTPSSKDQDTLILNTDLKGISIHLPKPYGKTAIETQPLSLLLRFSDVMDTLLSIHYENKASIHLAYSRLKKQYQFERGNIHLGGTKKELPTEDGLKIEGSLPEFSVSDWWTFFERMGQVGQHKKTILSKGDILFQLLQLQIDKIDLMGNLIHQAVVQLTPKNQGWNIHVKSEEVTGNIEIDELMNKGIHAQLDYLHVRSQKNKEKNSSKTNHYQPKDLFPLALSVKDFQYNKVHLGQMALVMRPNKKTNTLIINQLNFHSPATALDLKGTWTMNAGNSKSQLLGYLSSNNVHQTLINLGIEPVISGKKGLVTFNLNWSNSLSDFNTNLLNGLLDFKIEQGIITHLDKPTQNKIGIGQLLGLLSPVNLLKRLTLDFSDLSTKGLSFDRLKGNFVIEKGKMITNNTELESSVAYIAMTGTIDLGRKTYDLLFNISPHATGSLPVIATIAGGPIAGIATLVASTLINQGMKHSSMYVYKVEGPWKQPRIISESKNR